MKIVSILPTNSHVVTFEVEDEHRVRTLRNYRRYSPQMWMVVIGESDEVVNDCEGLELEFQRRNPQA